MTTIHTPPPKQHPAQTAAGLVRQWEDCLAPHDLPKWAEDAALTMRALVTLPAAPAEEDGGTPTPEQIAAAGAYWDSREGRADRMARRATRLHKLVKLRAPEVVIEQARRLMFDSLVAFPVDAVGSAAAERIDASIQAEESAFLVAHGYYDDPDSAAQAQGAVPPSGGAG